MFKQLAEVRDNNQGVITYHFNDGGKQVMNINPKVFFDERGRKRRLQEVMDIFTTTMWDLRAISFEI